MTGRTAFGHVAFAACAPAVLRPPLHTRRRIRFRAFRSSRRGSLTGATGPAAHLFNVAVTGNCDPGREDTEGLIVTTVSPKATTNDVLECTNNSITQIGRARDEYQGHVLVIGQRRSRSPRRSEQPTRRSSRP